ncbi:formyl transferase [Pelagophyceae sp. CCMP2097]|nr:formyl transferase [Pelagophyceae sp. CCMP2097]
MASVDVAGPLNGRWASLQAVNDLDVSNYSARSGGSADDERASCVSEHFYSQSAAKWPELAPKTTQKRPMASLRVLGADSDDVNMTLHQVLNSHNCRVQHSEQHRDPAANCFFQRASFDYSEMVTEKGALEAALQNTCARLNLEFQLWWGGPKRMAIFVSKYDHVLWDILLRHKAGELECDIPLIISNHDDLRPVAEAFGVEFRLFKINKENKRSVESEQIRLMASYGIDFVVLARYMQIISDDFCAEFPHRMINIHHSFLPAFIGAKPYHRAHERGVKLIGATAHYVTANLDEGPIIEQNVARVSHRDSVEDLLRKGRTIERGVLMEALRAHIEDRIVVYGNKTVVFE